MRVTIKDIAREANLSISAVSLVLNNRPCRVSEKNRELIRSIAKKYNYTANQAARSLVTQKSKMLGLIIPDIENLFFSSLAKVLEEICRKEGYALIITNTNDRYQDDLELIRLLAARGVDGLFLIVSNESYRDNAELLKLLHDLAIPSVMVDRAYPDYHCDKVSFDNETGAYLAVKHLLENGHRRIGCVASPFYSGNGRARLDGYRRAMKEYGCTIHGEYIVEGDYRFDSGYEAARELLNTDITAAFVCNDMMALGFLKGLYECRMFVPQDFSLVSYDNLLYPFVMGVELTSVEQNVEQLGTLACHLMLERLKGGESKGEGKEICLTPTLVIKGSVKAL